MLEWWRNGLPQKSELIREQKERSRAGAKRKEQGGDVDVSHSS